MIVMIFHSTLSIRGRNCLINREITALFIVLKEAKRKIRHIITIVDLLVAVLCTSGEIFGAEVSGRAVTMMHFVNKTVTKFVKVFTGFVHA
jgi:hypothetical protein